ncbi:unnamed protein product [Callosobruchus maculatus]|uniref:MARVEL domain-containing protein n=1 Tax=Callosobruchus maculatus TaxID=64391 RepID=A0A653BVZ4_CALMS|nr:unnamed protein product [Callosobruchus maculatus]
MQSEPSRYIHSVSDLLYTTDEIEYLLDDDIRDLEPKSYKPEEIQDFEIAGSRTGASVAGEGLLGDGSGSGGGVGATPNGGGDCPQGTGGCAECESPLGTVNSWDSHSHYRRNAPSPDLSLYEGVVVYCDHSHLRTPTGAFRLMLLITTVACLACLCTSGTVKLGLFMLPLVGRIRLMLFVTLISMFVTCLLLFLDISHIVYLFPFNWGKVNAYFYVSLSVLFLVASSLIFHMIFISEAFSWVPRWTHHQLLVTGCLGYVCCLESAVICLIQKCRIGQYEPVEEDLSFHLHERQTSPSRTSPDHKVNQTTHNYKPIVPIASTSRQEPQHHYLDDVQPCSSKSADPYRVV